MERYIGDWAVEGKWKVGSNKRARLLSVVEYNAMKAAGDLTSSSIKTVQHHIVFKSYAGTGR